MPYKIVKVVGGYKVKKDQTGHPKYFSGYPMTLEQAKKQFRILSKQGL
jgi:hypothetical protein